MHSDCTRFSPPLRRSPCAIAARGGHIRRLGQNCFSLWFIAIGVVAVPLEGWAGTIYWNMSAASPSSNTISGVTVGDVTQGNNNGTLPPMLSATSANNTNSYTFQLDSVSTAASAGNNAQIAARIGALTVGSNGSAYFQFSITPSSGDVGVTSVGFGSRATSTGPQAWTLRSDADSYASDLLTPGSLTNNSAWAYRTTSLTSTLTVSQNSTRIFRLYGYNGTGAPTAGSANWRVDDLQVVGIPVPEPAAMVLVSVGIGALAAMIRRRVVSR